MVVQSKPRQEVHPRNASGCPELDDDTWPNGDDEGSEQLTHRRRGSDHVCRTGGPPGVVIAVAFPQWQFTPGIGQCGTLLDQTGLWCFRRTDRVPREKRQQVCGLWSSVPFDADRLRSGNEPPQAVEKSASQGRSHASSPLASGACCRADRASLTRLRFARLTGTSSPLSMTRLPSLPLRRRLRTAP